jgi:hypothetical protein
VFPSEGPIFKHTGDVDDGFHFITCVSLIRNMEISKATVLEQHITMVTRNRKYFISG